MFIKVKNVVLDVFHTVKNAVLSAFNVVRDFFINLVK